MKTITRFLAAVAMAACVAAPSQAQEQVKPYPYMFVGLQGGGQIALQDYWDHMDSFIGQVSLGGFFTPVVGARLGVQGWQTKGALESVSETYGYKYANANLDLLINLSNLITGKDYNRFNVILLGGVGLDYAWDNDDLKGLANSRALGMLPYTENLGYQWNDDLLSHNFRVGLMLDYDICRNLSVNLEAGVNSKGDRWNSIYNGHDDWQAYGLLGLAVKFGHKKVQAVPAPVVVEPEPVWETRIDTIWYDETSYKDVEVMESIERNIHFPIRDYNSKHPARAELQQIADFVKSHKDCKVDIKSYADKGTGNPRINKKYSEQRRQGTVEALVELGVAGDIITSSSYGDTVQPFAENDQNRVSITTATGKAIKKEPVKTRKFRTEEKRVRVQ